MENYYSKQCYQDNLDAENIEDLLECFRVRLTFNGEWLRIQECYENNQANGVDSYDCTYNDFIDYMEVISFPDDQLDPLCFTPFIPEQNEVHFMPF